MAEAIQRVVNAAGMAAALTVGRQRHMPEAACPHYNVLTDAEWGPLSGKYVANERKLAYGCELQPGHAGPHMSEVQLVPADPDQFVWIRWTDRQRELIALAPCQAEYVSDRAEDPTVCTMSRACCSKGTKGSAPSSSNSAYGAASEGWRRPTSSIYPTSFGLVVVWAAGARTPVVSTPGDRPHRGVSLR
ncbi:hypothetical protein [Nonomuraea sp. 10N515B]|uniref:hypothetical protein n=1 Tax=Nonomuraea sp. 10N515B TaxID=3457422 RepID=UPI003FCE6904